MQDKYKSLIAKYKRELINFFNDYKNVRYKSMFHTIKDASRGIIRYKMQLVKKNILKWPG